MRGMFSKMVLIGVDQVVTLIKMMMQISGEKTIAITSTIFLRQEQSQNDFSNTLDQSSQIFS